MNIVDLEHKTKEELVELAKEMGITSATGLKKQELIMLMLESHTEQQGNIFCSGILVIMYPASGSHSHHS